MNEMNTNIYTQTTTDKDWNQTALRFDYRFLFAFRTKAEYLEFRRLWKANYADLSVSIRGLKSQIRDTMRRQEYAGKLQIELHLLKSHATVQLAMRKAAKAEAARQVAAVRPSGI